MCCVEVISVEETWKQLLDEMRLLRKDVSGLAAEVAQLKSQLNQLQKSVSDMAVVQDYVLKEAKRHNTDIHLLRHEADEDGIQVDINRE